MNGESSCFPSDMISLNGDNVTAGLCLQLVTFINKPSPPIHEVPGKALGDGIH